MEDHDGEGDMVTCPGDGEPLLLAPAWGQEEQLCQHPRVKAEQWQEIPSRRQHTLQEAVNRTPGLWSVAQHKDLLSSSTKEASWKGDTNIWL